jgi:hypothetical protein
MANPNQAVFQAWLDFREQLLLARKHVAAAEAKAGRGVVGNSLQDMQENVIDALVREVIELRKQVTELTPNKVYSPDGY